jgi:hypothetical protein
MYKIFAEEIFTLLNLKNPSPGSVLAVASSYLYSKAAPPKPPGDP